MRQIAITLDTDWAPDFVIDYVAQRLVEANVRATWFVTHASSAIKRLRHHPELFELGLHPDFSATSTQGRDPLQVLQYCQQLVPEATAMRTHGLLQSTRLLLLALKHTSIQTDLSLYLPGNPHVQPIECWYDGKRLIRLPHIWEDDFAMQQPQRDWNVLSVLARTTGVLVFDFHPIHVYLNSPSMAAYKLLKQRVDQLTDAKHQDLKDLIWPASGTRTFFEALIQAVRQQHGDRRISDVVEDWLNKGLGTDTRGAA